MTRARRRQQPTVGLGIVALAFVAGMLVDSWLRVYGPPMPAVNADASPTTAPSEKPRAIGPIPTSGHSGRLDMPIEGTDAESLKGGFGDARTGHPHEAVDILAPRHTPVHAVEDGTIAKLFISKAGGNTIYEFDETGRYAYYYAHLQRYETGLKEGDAIKKGQVIGFVGTSGNAPPNTPHLHFAVFELGPEHQWWKGQAIDPYPLFR